MSIPRLNPADAQRDPFDTALIARLANELYAEFNHAPSPSAQPAVARPLTVEDHGLAGAYPADYHAYAPPVHPASHTAASPSAAVYKRPCSGEHTPDSADSHPFGEPSCVLGKNNSPRRADAQPAADVQPPAVAQPPADAQPAGSGFYFLTPREASPPAAAPTVSGFDVERVRRDFPALHQQVNGRPLVWLDNAATTHKPLAVIRATEQFYRRDNSNIHRAAHTLAARATDWYEGGREKVRGFLGAADAREIIFTRGTTEAINLLAQTFGKKFIGSGDEILLTHAEHHANIVPWQLLAQQTGAVIKVAPISDSGELLLDQFAALLSRRTKIAAVTHVANALGTVNPIEQIIPLAHAHGVPVLVDAAQSAPHLPLNARAFDADFLALSGHKIFGPTGIGVLYGKAQWLEQLPPWQGGGNMIKDVTFGHTEYQSYPQKFEAGTQDIAGVVGLGAAVDYLQQLGLPAIAVYEHELLEHGTAVLEKIPGLRLIGTAPHKASVLSFVIDSVPPEQIAKHLDRHGIAVRAGHHCAQPALRRYGLESTVRPSLAFYNTFAELDALGEALRQLPRN